MPRTSRHKYSKHSSSSKEYKDYSDSERDSSLKENTRKSSSNNNKDDNTIARVRVSNERRNLDLGESNAVLEEYNSSSSKRWKEKIEHDGVKDRWIGGVEDDHLEGCKKSSKALIESKSKRRDDIEAEDVKKSSGKSRKEGREGGGRKEGREGGGSEREQERERKSKDGKSEKLGNSQLNGISEAMVQQRQLLDLESDNQLARRAKRRKDGSGDGDKQHNDMVGLNDLRLSSRDDFPNDGKSKNEKHKSDKHKDKYRDDADRDIKHREERQRDERPTKDLTNGRSDKKPPRDEKDMTEVQQKKSKLADNDSERDYGRKTDRERDFGRERDRERGKGRDRERDRDHGRARDCDQDRDLDYDWDWDLDRDRERDRRHRDRDGDRDRDLDRNRDRDFDNERDLDLDGPHINERSLSYKESRGKRKSPDDHSDYDDAKGKVIKAQHPDMGKKSASSGKVEAETDRGRAQSHQVQVDTTVSGTRRRASPSPSSHGGIDDYRHLKQDDMKYRDSVTEQKQRGNSSREVTGYSGVLERGSKYRPAEKPVRLDDGHLRDLSIEKTSNPKASTMTLVERSPSSTSFERKYTNRSGIRRSHDADEAGWRSSASGAAREKSTDRFSRDLLSEKPPTDDSTLVDSSTYGRTGQINSSSLIHPPSYRGGVNSPSFTGPMEEDSRVNTNTGYKRDGDPHIRRRQGTAWRPPQNWSPALPNGFISFQHGPPHGGFQTMMSLFPSPMFGMRPSMDMSHSGLPYHIPEADRFSSHLRPLGWPGSAPSNLHGWDGNNGVFRDEAHMYGPPDWDQNRHPMHGRGWESSSDMWKGQNGDMGMEKSQKEDYSMQQPSNEGPGAQTSLRSQDDDSHFGTVKAKASAPKSLLTTIEEEKPGSEDDNSAHRCCAYLRNLDISSELAGPELYGQCMSLLEMEEHATTDEDSNAIINLKDGGRAIPKGSIMLLSPSFLPAANDSAFHRAMNHYRNQREETGSIRIFNRKTLDLISSSNQDRLGKQDDIGEVERAEEATPHAEVEMTDTPVAPSDQKEGEAVSSFLTNAVDEKAEELDPGTSKVKSEELQLIISEEKMEELNPIIEKDKERELDPNISDEVQSGDQTSSLVKLEELDDVPSLKEPITGESAIPGTEDDMDCCSSLKNAPEAMSVDDDGSADVKMEASGEDTISDLPLILSEGSPPIIPIESESVTISRIHDSPPSTH